MSKIEPQSLLLALLVLLEAADNKMLTGAFLRSRALYVVNASIIK